MNSENLIFFFTFPHPLIPFFSFEFGKVVVVVVR